MAGNESFGFDPEDLDRLLRGAGDQLRGVFGKFFDETGERPNWTGVFDDFGRGSRPAPEPKTAGKSGDGVWVIYTVDADGGAVVEQVHPTELDALRANQDNTDVSRKVRFLPYGIAVTVLDASDPSPEAATDDSAG